MLLALLLAFGSANAQELTTNITLIVFLTPLQVRTRYTGVLMLVKCVEANFLEWDGNHGNEMNAEFGAVAGLTFKVDD